MFRFEYINYLYALLVIPVLITLFVIIMRWRKKALQNFAESGMQQYIIPNTSPSKIIWKFVFWVLALAVLIVGIANPQFGTKLEEVKREGVDIMICLDISNSMKAQDLPPNRLENAKQSINKLINNLHDDRIGIIVFAGESMVQLPSTTDYATAKLFLNNIDCDLIATQGTAIGAAIDLAIESFDKKSPAGKSIIVITDGENHEDDAVKAAEKAIEQGIIVSTIGMGSESGVPIPYIVNGAVSGYRKDMEGNTVVTKLNQQLLEEIAHAGKGIYVHAGRSQSALSIIIDELNKMDKKEYGSKKYTDYEGRFQFFIAVALLLLILETIFSEKKSLWIQKLNLFGEHKNSKQ